MSRLENSIFVRLGVYIVYYCILALAMRWLGFAGMVMFGFASISADQTLDRIKRERRLEMGFKQDIVVKLPKGSVIKKGD